MNALVRAQIGLLHDLTMRELREKYQELFGDESRTWNRQFLLRRIAWRLQALTEGGLSERAYLRAMQLARDADLRVRPPRPVPEYPISQSKRDTRLPTAGSMLQRSCRGTLHQVKVCADGFDYNGQRFRSLSAVPFAISGTRWNGYSFFGLNGHGRG
jgi:hypothetical protein